MMSTCSVSLAVSRQKSLFIYHETLLPACIAFLFCTASDNDRHQGNFSSNGELKSRDVADYF